MKNQNSLHRRVFYHTYSTYIQASNQAITDQIPTKKGTSIPKAKKKIVQNKKKS